MQPLRILTLAVFVALTGCDSSHPADSGPENSFFERETIDPRGPNAPWGKTIGDIDGDGLLDIVIGGHRPRHLTFLERVGRKLGINDSSDRLGELVWYENPTWKRHTITESLAIRTDLEVFDIDGDGANDIVLVSDSGIVWLKNGDWGSHVIGGGKYHDVEVADLDRDGAAEVIVRNQSLFGYKNGNFIRIFTQKSDAQWSYEDLSVPHGEGLTLADLDKDGFSDIVASDVWLRNPGESVDTWARMQYTGAGEGGWHWHNVYIDTGDFNGDGWPDILLSPSEPVGALYEIAWLENPGRKTDQYWLKHLIVEDVETVHHFVAARDVDLDGDMDVLTAEMNQGEGENPVSVYMNEPNGWVRQTLSLGGGHSLRAVDIDNDFDIDLIGTNWQIKDFQGDYPVWIWRNQLDSRQSWVRHVIDDERPGQATAVFAEDLDRDGKKDLVSGGFWYRNPGALGDQWRRSEFGPGATDAALIHDFDRDGRPDVLATGWRAYGYQTPFWEKLANWWVAGSRDKEGNHGERLVWARNLGAGEFEILENIHRASGDFLQGAAVLPAVGDGEERVLLSWHAAGEGIQSITVPKEARHQEWAWSEFSSLSLDEALTVADLDADQNPDVILGTVILFGREGGDWETVWIDDEGLKPDRHVVADLNSDGLPDIVVGFEAVSETGDLAWYQQLTQKGDWEKHLIARLTGPMSLGVEDMDDDGDPDVIVGEHDLRNPERARLLWFENRSSGESWLPRLIHQGDEHHDGALVVDLDGDGDQDVVSIGWGHHKVIVYESVNAYGAASD